MKMLFTIFLIVNDQQKQILFIDIMKKHFRKELAMTKKDEKNFENSTKCYICVNVYVDGEIKLRDHCHIAGKH